MAKSRAGIEFGDLWAHGATPESNHERCGNDFVAWMYWIFVLENSARIIGESASHQEDEHGHIMMPAVLAVRAMLTGYAIECALSAFG